jgi:hypothetical protein
VPNIDELLSPPNQRSKIFWVGSHEFNPEKLGYKSTERELSAEERVNLFRFDASLLGNGNGGHAYPAKPYSTQEREAVIEYLKSASLDSK